MGTLLDHSDQTANHGERLLDASRTKLAPGGRRELHKRPVLRQIASSLVLHCRSCDLDEDQVPSYDTPF